MAAGEFSNVQLLPPVCGNQISLPGLVTNTSPPATKIALFLLPGSALPGWPAEVPLPVDPVWKQDYAASVRRLIRDGVDVPLAHLFVRASQAVPPDREGIDRARSASEAFLFRRLQSLAETTGRFRLNVELPIPFNGSGCMEVDFLCTDSSIVIELDGGQHLADADAYRRDRRKDQLLQQHGYLVLRFLADDLGKRLDLVLDAVLSALSHRRNSEGSVGCDHCRTEMHPSER